MRTRARGGSVSGSNNTHNRNAPHVHVTIAPIAPTMLKTTDPGLDVWTESFGDEGGSDDGLWGNKWAYNDGEGWKERDKVQSQDDEATPVELVYVPPPLVGHYSVGSDDEEDHDIGAEEKAHEQKDDDTPRPSSSFITPRILDDAPVAESPQATTIDLPSICTVTPPTPTVIVESQPVQTSRVQEVSMNEVASLSPSNRQDSFSRRPSSPEDRHSTSRSRSRTHSRSRTPSPAVNIPSSETSKNVAAPIPLSARGRSSSISPPEPPSSSLLCPPVQRGRSASYQDLPSRGQRGRSSTRTPPSYSDRERQGESPIGSLSPDSSFVRVSSIVGGVYASGRTDKERLKDKDKERREEQYRDRGRDGERGRDRIGRTPSQSLSPDVEMKTSKRGSSSPAGRADDNSTQIKRSPTSEETYHVVGKAKSSSDVPAK